MSKRSAGVLLHVTSLPGRYGVGDLGPEVEVFLDWARDAGQSWWQVLPVGPPAAGDSPYSALSAFAGNPLLISLDLLIRDGLLDPGDVTEAPDADAGRVDYPRAAAWKTRILRRSWERFQTDASSTLRDALDAFTTDPSQEFWLDDWALYATIRRRFDNHGWWDWPPALARREADALAEIRREAADEISYQNYLQFLFRRQWLRLRRLTHDHGLRLLGDLPIYVALDSADVWAHRQVFDLDDAGRPQAVAGVPPDDYSEDGQLWGNPLYRWDDILDDGREAEGMKWWSERLRSNLALCDRVRLDHFRGFAGYWRVPAEAETAAAGEWVQGPGRPFFDALADSLGEDLPLIAEDLGVITEDVEELRDGLGFPGMKVLHFAFGDDDSTHLPKNIEPASVVYTGTHDNDTTLGWFESLDEDSLRRLRHCLKEIGLREIGLGEIGDPAHIHWTMIRLAYDSAAETAIIPVQDVLGLGHEARMNTPAVAEGNWSWRLEASQLTPDLARRLRSLVQASDRLS